MYSGWELEAFDNAFNFRNYQHQIIRRFIENKKICDIGTGSGGLVNYYLKSTSKIFLVEPSKNLYKKTKKKFKNKVKIYKKYSEIKNHKFDAIIYMDVIEHIHDYEKDLLCKIKNLKIDGYLIISVPAFNFLYTNYDKEIGHFKRFEKSDFINFSKKNKLVIKKLYYYDLIGFLLIFINKFIFNKTLSAMNFKKSVHIWNSLIPLSKLFDFLIFNLFGKSLICILQKKH
jgi:hypothetical protein